MRLVLVLATFFAFVNAKASSFNDRAKGEDYSKTNQLCLDLVALEFSGSRLENNFDSSEAIIPLRNGQLGYMKDGNLTVYSDSGSNKINGLACEMDRKNKIGKFLESIFNRRGEALKKDSKGREEAIQVFRRQLNECAKYFPEVASLSTKFSTSNENQQGASPNPTKPAQ
jgi:hypothetical protein